MKRNNIFMWAYISFIFVAMIVRLFFDYSLWTPLVIAITISSILFAIEDLYSSLAKALSEMCSITDNFTPAIRNWAEIELAFYDEASESIKIFKNIGYDISTLQSSFEFKRIKTAEIIQQISDIENESTHWKDKHNHHQKKADFFAYFGFFVLFCTLIFASSIVIPTTTQDVFTVFSFSVILITNQINSDQSAKINGYMLKCQDILQEQREVEKDFLNLKKEYSELIADIESLSDKNEEVLSHAD